MNKVISFAKEHPAQVALLAGVAVLAVFYFMGGSGSSNSGQASQEAALQNAYFQAEAIQAQSGASIQNTNTKAAAAVAINQQNVGASTANATTWASEATAVNASNNAAATAALPYATEDQLIGALANVSSQTQTTTSKSGGFFGIGGGSKQVTTSTPAAISASNYLDELVNGLYAGH